MSVKIMGQVWDSDLAHNLKYTLLAYADHADHDGRNVFPSMQTVAWKTGYSRRAVQLNTRTLQEMGVLVDDGVAGNNVNRWRIDVAKLPQRAARGENFAQHDGEGVKILHGRGENFAQQGVKILHGGGENFAPDPSIDPSVEPSVEPSQQQQADAADASVDGDAAESAGVVVVDFDAEMTEMAEAFRSAEIFGTKRVDILAAQPGTTAADVRAVGMWRRGVNLGGGRVGTGVVVGMLMRGERAPDEYYERDDEAEELLDEPGQMARSGATVVRARFGPDERWAETTVLFPDGRDAGLVWQGVLGQLRLRLSPQVFDAWLARSWPVRWTESDGLVVGVPSRQHVEMLRDRLAGQVGEALASESRILMPFCFEAQEVA